MLLNWVGLEVIGFHIDIEILRACGVVIFSAFDEYIMAPCYSCWLNVLLFFIPNLAGQLFNKQSLSFSP